MEHFSMMTGLIQYWDSKVQLSQTERQLIIQIGAGIKPNNVSNLKDKLKAISTMKKGSDRYFKRLYR